MKLIRLGLLTSSMSSGNQGGVVDVETVEINVTNRPAKSNPVNMPVSSSLLPVVIEGSSGSKNFALARETSQENQYLILLGLNTELLTLCGID